MIFSLLVPLVHRNDTLGDSARDSFLLIFAISKKDDQLGQYLAYESDICPVSWFLFYSTCLFCLRGDS
ncbi:unnamed protein product [Trichobilharzia regenti]|nr:unnamed protein product [Trichobilharzia regenti]